MGNQGRKAAETVPVRFAAKKEKPSSSRLGSVVR